ncbi:MAG TPA: hypothetical protein VIN40_05530 [Candidatus Tyrphobacter sp.]
MNADTLDARVARLEGIIEQISYRLASIEQRLGMLEQKVDANRDRSDQQFRWLFGLIVVSIILPLVARLLGH